MITNDAYKVNVGASTENTVSIKSNKAPIGILYKVTSDATVTHWNKIHPDDYDAASNYGDGINRLESGPNSGRFITQYAAGSATNYYITTGVVDSITGITASDLESEYTSFEATPQSNVNRIYKGSNLIWHDKNSHVYVSGTTRVSGQGANLSTTLFRENDDIKSFSLIGDAVTSLPDYVFYRSPNLITANIGDSITGIGVRAFQSCSGLTSINIPDSVTSIGHTAFNACRSLSSVTIGDGLTSIDNGAFSFCISVTGINIPEGVTSIADSAFQFMSGITNFTVPNSATSIGNSSFMNNTSLTGVTIGNGVTSIDNSAFKNCTSLTGINLLAASPPTSGTIDIFNNVPSNCKIHVLATASAAYGSTYGGLEVVADLS